MRRARVVVAAGLSLAAAACGTTQLVGASRTLQVAVTEYHLSPQQVSVPAGVLTVIVHNFGRLVHNLAVTQNGHLEGETKPVRPGATAMLKVNLAPGSYRLASNLFDDQTLGTYGTLIVTHGEGR